MNIFTSLFSWFKRHFGPHGDAIKTVLSDTSVIINAAVPIVKDLKALVPDTKLIDPSTAIGKVQTFINMHASDVLEVQSVVAGLAGKNTKDILQSVGEWVLGMEFPGTSSSVLRWALEGALQIALKELGVPVTINAPTSD